MHIRGVFAAEGRDLHGIPHNVIGEDRLKPEGLQYQPTSPHFRVPEKETRSEGFTADFYPARRINQETEHVLFACIQARGSVETLLVE